MLTFPPSPVAACSPPSQILQDPKALEGYGFLTTAVEAARKLDARSVVDVAVPDLLAWKEAGQERLDVPNER